MISCWLPLLMCMLFLCACTPTEPQPTAAGTTPASITPSPSPVPSATATASLAPFTRETAVIVLEEALIQPSATATPLSLNLPLEKAFIQRPGPGSQITSPVRVTGRAGPTWNNEVLLRLVGEDGRLIQEETTVLFANPGNAGLFSDLLSFETPLVAEAARLEVHNFSRRDGKLDHIGSVDLVLLSVGAERMYWDFQGAEQLTLFTPQTNDVISGGTLLVRGAGWVNAEQPLRIEVYDRQDTLIGSGETQIQSQGPMQLGYFEAEIAYQVEVQQLSRILVWESSTTIPGIRHLTSVYVYLQP